MNHRLTWNYPLNYCGQQTRSTASYTCLPPFVFYKSRLLSAWFPFIAASFVVVVVLRFGTVKRQAKDCTFLPPKFDVFLFVCFFMSDDGTRSSPLYYIHELCFGCLLWMRIVFSALHDLIKYLNAYHPHFKMLCPVSHRLLRLNLIQTSKESC